MELTNEQLLVAYRTMRMIRSFEEKLSDLVTGGKLGGFLHLYAGQEAVAAGVCRQLDERDWVSTTHRGHGHCIAKGVRVKGMMAELFGRRTGVCKGKGGSMHIADLDAGMLGANGIVGASIPLATGAALTCKTKRTGGVAVAFFGDGASNQGQFHESLNMAANWRLPVVYVVENNGWGEFAPTAFVVPVADIAVRATSYGMRSDIADGNDGRRDRGAGGKSERPCAASIHARQHGLRAADVQRADGFAGELSGPGRHGAAERVAAQAVSGRHVPVSWRRVRRYRHGGG
jgi:TPP-dependent pyruvate/acetoin dehydrogenase alpha subunit